ncbi:MAG: ATPase [Bacteroidetes bacterium B1(2017)]|nr:MAG: ATPase [Bacteroidetes bacterium B1(2017)]
MYTELIKIVEGGLEKDIKKVSSFARLLAEKLAIDGEEKMSKVILNLLDKKKSLGTVNLDELATTPMDQESRMNIVDLILPEAESEQIVLDKITENKISDFVNSVNHKKALIKAGIKTNNSLLLYGVPGGGKTSIAKLISQKTQLPLVTARLDAIVSSLLGNTSKNIRKIFDYADRKPCILFLDEFDAIAKARDDQYELGELKRVINSLLQNIDAFSENNILIAATNHPELLDKAIWRRFNTVIEIGKPSEEEISSLINVFLKEFKNDLFEDKKRSEKLVKLMVGKTPADIKSILNNAMTHVIIHNKKELVYEDLLIELFEFENHGSTSNEKLVEYLNINGIAQANIAEKLNVSIRQVRNVLSKEI